MRTTPPALLPLLRSRVQGDLLALLYLHPEAEYTVSEVAAFIEASVKVVSQEASRLGHFGIVVRTRRGNLTFLRANSDTPISKALTDLLAVTYGPRPVLTDLLVDIDGVEEAFIYGSWAARYEGEVGAVPNDVDVLVIGTAGREALGDVANASERRLHRPVNIRRISSRQWKDPKTTDPFLLSVRNRPLVRLVPRASERGEQ